MKIESKFMCDGESYDFELSTRGIKIYLNESSDRILIADKEDNVFAIVEADCAQNSGFLKVFTP